MKNIPGIKSGQSTKTVGVQFPGNAMSSASFETPVELLQACHDRIDKQCKTLQRLCKHVQTHGTDASASSAATNILRYFDVAGPHHHSDEEKDVFPVLLERVALTEREILQKIINQLCEDHVRMEELWQELRPSLQLIADLKPATLSEQVVADFVALYKRHIEQEEKEIIPLSQKLLNADDISKLGNTMRARRTDSESISPSS